MGETSTHAAAIKLPHAIRLDLFRHPDINGDAVHDTCGRTMNEHGWIDPGSPDHEGLVPHPDGLAVCPRRGVDYTAGALHKPNLPGVWTTHLR